MFATLARMVPESALASLLSSAAAKLTWLFSSFTTTPGDAACWSVPRGPFTTIFAPSTVTWTLSGTATGYLATRDIVGSRSLHDDAEDFAPHAGFPGAAVGHHAPGRGDDRHAEAVHHARNVVATLVDAKAGARDALDLLDHGLAGVVLEADLDEGLAFLVAVGVVLDVALVLEDLGDGALHLRGGHEYADLLRRLRVADAGQHVGDGITHAHMSLLPARLDHAGDLAAHRDLADLVAREAEFAERAARAAGDGAPVAQPDRGRVAGLRLQLGAGLVAGVVGRLRILDDREQRLALLGVLFHHGFTFRLAVDDGKLGHYAALSVLNGNRNAARSARASSSVFAVVVMLMFMPRIASTLSYSISGKMICSLMPML